MGAYIEREGRQFGFETRVRVYAAGKTKVGEQIDEGASPFFALKFVCKVWAQRRGHGWLPVR